MAPPEHRQLGLRYLAASLGFFMLAGADATALRVQLARPESDLIDARDFEQLFTMHGTGMVFLFAVPAALGLALYLVPPRLGRDELPWRAFAAAAFWLYLLGGLGLYASALPDVVNFVLPGDPAPDLVPGVGWTGDPPMSLHPNEPGPSTLFWVGGVLATTVAHALLAAYLVGLVLFGRRPDLPLRDLPLLCWSVLAAALAVLLAFPPAALGVALLAAERGGFLVAFDPARGGDLLLWRQLFWIAERPEALAVFLPGAGLVSAVLADEGAPGAGGDRQFGWPGRAWTVAALLAPVPLALVLWLLRVLAPEPTLLGASASWWWLGLSAVAAALLIAPAGVLVAAWSIALRRSPAPGPALVLAAGAALFLVLGALTGAAALLRPTDGHAHGTYVAVALLHYVLLAGGLFPVLAAIHRWADEAGWRLDPWLAHGAAWLLVAGALLAFLPQHALGLLGMPRRVVTYQAEVGLDLLNLLSTAGTAVMALGALAVAGNLALSLVAAEPTDA